MIRFAPHLIIATLLLIAVSACGAASDSTASVTVRRGNGGDPETLDPHRAEDVHAFAVLNDLYEGLTAIDADGKIVPGVATSWQLSEDGLRYTFHLDPEARWSDGSPVTSVQFAAGLRRSLSPETASAYSFLLLPIRNALRIQKGVEPPASLGVSASDEWTLTIHLEQRTPHLLSILAMPIAYPLWTGLPLVDSRFSTREEFVGNGPFVLENWHPESVIRLRKNPRFREASSVDVDIVEYYPISNPTAELNMYRAGELDITATVPGPHVPELRESHADELQIAPSLALYYLAFDLSEAPLDIPSLRQALSMAIDRESLVRVIGRGEQPAYGLVPDGVNGYAPARFPWASLSRASQIALSRELYERSGYDLQNPLSLRLLYDAGDIHEKVAVAVSAMWRETLGVAVDLDKREWKYFLETRERRGDWDVMRFAWSGDYNHPSTFTSILESSSPQNLPRYSNSRYDDLLNAALSAADLDEQMQLLSTAEGVMLDDNPIVPLYFYVSKHMVSPAIAGFRHNALDQHPSRYLSKTTQ